MQLPDWMTVGWIPAITTTSLLGVALWLARSLIENRLTKSVQHEFDHKLETVRAELRRREELYKAELKAKDDALASLRSGALSALASRQVALDNRRIEAVEQLWSAISSLGSAKTASAMMAPIKFDIASQRSAEDPRLRQVFDLLGGPFEKVLEDVAAQQRLALKARPFVSEIAWALFSAYVAIVSLALFRLKMLKAGVDTRDWINTDAMKDLIKAALPHQTQLLEKYGLDAAHYLLDELETRLLTEMRGMLRSTEGDKESVQLAAVILAEVNRVTESLTKPEEG